MLGTLADRIVYFDIASLVLLIIIVCTLVINKMIKGTQNLVFLGFIALVFTTTVLDISRALIPNYAREIKNGLGVSYLIQTLYFVTRMGQLPLYMIYAAVASNSLYNFKRHKTFLVVLLAPFLLSLCMIFGNLFVPIIFTFDKNLNFYREQGMLYLYGVSVIYLIAVTAYIFYYKKLFGKGQVAALFSLILLNILAVTSQILFPRMLVEMFCTTIAVLLITITFHHPEGLRNTELDVMTYKTFVQEIEKSSIIKKSQTIIFAGIKNYKHIYSILPYNDMHLLLSHATIKIRDLDKNYKLKSRIYYFDNGTFAIVAPSEKKENMKKACGELYNYFANELTVEKLGIKIIPSFCIFSYPEDIITSDEVITFGRTYQKLIPTKKSYVDISEIREKTDFRLRNEINEIISKAISNQNFEMYYQPIFNTKTQSFKSAEALIRLKDDKYGFVSPEIFIAAAERTGAIYQIGDFILDEVCGFIGSEDFKRCGLDYIEINLSVAQCLQIDLADKIKAMISKHRINPSQINLEITERESIYDQVVFDNNMKQLTEIGINFSLDDYGTGYSNIRRIFQLPLKMVKIDKSFVDDIETPQTLSIVRSTIKMLKDINKQIVVEGVEDAEAARIFTEMDCEYIQGYYYSRPLDRQAFVNFIMEKNK